MIVFVHGSQSDRRVYGPLLALAPADAETSTLDLPDHGAAPDQPTPDPEPLRRALLEHLHGLPDGPLTLVGHSLGSHLIASIAPRLERPVQRAYLTAGFARLHEQDVALYRAMATGLETGRLDLELLREMALEAALGERHAKPEHHALVTEMQIMPFDRAVRSLRRGLEMSEMIAPYGFPATVVHGRDDAAIRLALGQELADAGTDARLVVWETDSHMLPLTHAEALAELIFAG